MQGEITNPTVAENDSRYAEYQQILDNPRLRRLAAGVVSVWTAGTLSAGILAVEEHNQGLSQQICNETDIDCYLDAAGLGDPVVVLQNETTTTVLPEVVSDVTTSLPEVPTTSAISPTELAVSAVNLTPQGYSNFLATIDQSFFDYAQQFIEFNPNTVPIPQNQASAVFVWHFTVLTYNGDGVSVPAEQTNVAEFVRMLAQRYDERPNNIHLCCGVNWFIDRGGRAYQLAPLNAKLRHNPPYDAVNTGVEVEAQNQDALTSAQYETLAYLTIAVLQIQGLLGIYPLEQIVQGHGEMRDAWRAQNPNATEDVRDDFDFPVSNMLRQKIANFLQTNPEITSLTTQLRS